MRTIPWATLLCEMGTCRPILRWTAAKHGTINEPFYKEAASPIEADGRALQRHSFVGLTPSKESVGTQKGYASLPSRCPVV